MSSSFEKDSSSDADPQSQKICSVCFFQISNVNIVWQCYNCQGHYWCKGCFNDTCFSSHRNFMPGIPKCVACDAKPPFDVMKLSLGDDKWNQWTEKMSMAKIIGDRCYVACPTPDCPMWYYDECERDVCQFTCIECKVTRCITCLVIWNEEEDHQKVCRKRKQVSEDVQMWLAAKETDDAKQGKSCPKCKMLIIRTGGCKRVTCDGCGTDTCWVCGNVDCVCCGRCQQIPCICCKRCHRPDCLCCPTCKELHCKCCQRCYRPRPNCSCENCRREGYCDCCQRCNNLRAECICCPRCNSIPNKEGQCRCCKRCKRYKNCDCCIQCNNLRENCMCCEHCKTQRNADGKCMCCSLCKRVRKVCNCGDDNCGDDNCREKSGGCDCCIICENLRDNCSCSENLKRQRNDNDQKNPDK